MILSFTCVLCQCLRVLCARHGAGGGACATPLGRVSHISAGPWPVRSTDCCAPSPTARAVFLQELASVKDVVDVVAPCSYYIQQTPPHGLVRKDGANTLHQVRPATRPLACSGGRD